MPSNVRYFTYLSYLSFLIGALNFFLGIQRVSAVAMKNSGLLVATMAVMATLGVLLPLALVLLAAYGKQNWARWVLAIMYGYGLVASIPMLIAMSLRLSPLVLETLLQSALQGAALYLVFTGNAKDWFRKQEDVLKVFE